MAETPAATLSRELSIVRIKLGADRPAPQPDPLGRERIGYADDLAIDELWQRGRGVWKARLATVAEADLVVLVADGVTRLVASVDGATFHDDRIAVVGTPQEGHPLIGGPDPIPNKSQNPIAYGTIVTAPASASLQSRQRPYDAVLADAIATLTEAVHWRRPVLQQTEAGRWEQHPTQTERGDWAEFVTLALAGAAANAGGIEPALAGRPGSWEAEGVRQLLVSTVGTEESELWRHRTDPVEITLYADELVTDLFTDVAEQYMHAEAEIQRRFEAAELADPEVDDTDYIWWYDRTDTGDFIARDPSAPPWSWDAWRTQPARPGGSPEFLARVEESLRTGVGLFTGRPGDVTSAYIAKSAEAAAELWRLEDERDARLQLTGDLDARLEEQRIREWTAYGNALKDRIIQLAAETPGLDVPVHIAVDVETCRISRDVSSDSLESRLIEAAVDQTPSPADLPGTPLSRLFTTD